MGVGENGKWGGREVRRRGVGKLEVRVRGGGEGKSGG